MKQQLYDLLRQCTVRVLVPGKMGHGTGFFVAPGLILTCAHVLKGVQSASPQIEVYWKGQSHLAGIQEFQQDYDLALLQVNLSDHPCVYLHEEATPFDALYSYGYPDDHSSGDPATFTLDGKAGEQGEQLKFKTGQVRPGMSGAPLLNARTGCVCGVIQLTRDRNNDLGGRAIPITMVFGKFPELRDLQRQFHLRDRLWVEYIAPFHSKQPVGRPRNYIPFPRNPLFQPRYNEFERLERLLFATGENRPPIRIGLVGLGMVGMGGIGKTQLAVEFAYRYLNRFPGGVFWMTAAGKSIFDWYRPLAELAFKTSYLPPGDDVSNRENELRRAMHFCHYLASFPDTLFILDNVEDPNLVISALPAFVGGELACTILYTSRNKLVPNGVTTYQVEQLPEDGALRLLLDGMRSSSLYEALSGGQSPEAQAARILCQGVGYLPLALVHLRGLLARGQGVRLTRLAEILKQRGVLDITKALYNDPAPLFATFRLSWEKVKGEETHRLFKLASYFPEAFPIPLWLLGLASGLGEDGDFFGPLGQACMQLQELSLIEELSGEQVRLHPLIREFGRKLMAEEGDRSKVLLEEAGERLIHEFANLNKLEHRASDVGYWVCLKQVRSALEYIELLDTGQAEPLKRVERWLDRESYLLADKHWWPKVLPGLFFQQIYNRSLEEDIPLPIDEIPIRWIRLVARVGAESHFLLRVFSGHTSSVESVAFSPDGSKVLTGSTDETARLWETSGKLMFVFKGHTNSIESVAFSTNGSKILTGSQDKTARLWDMKSGKLLITLEGHTTWVTSVAFSPDGSKVLTGSADKTARLWETSGKLIFVFKGHTNSIESVAFSPDGSKVLTGSEDDSARLWETRYGRLLTIFAGHNNWVNSVAFSPDGSKVLTGSYDGTARIWLAKGDKSSIALDTHSNWITDVKFSLDGSKVLTGSNDGTARLWETESGKLLLILKGHTDAVRGVAFSPDGSKVLTGSNDGTARLWETESGKLLLILKGHTGIVRSVTFSPDGRRISTCSSDGSVGLWEMPSERLLATLKGHVGGAHEAVFSPDGSKVLTSSSSVNDLVRLWNTTSGELLAELEDHTGGITCMVFSPDGNKVLAASEDNTAKIWETRTGKLLTTFKGHTNVVWAAAFSPDGSKVLTGSADGTARLWSAKNGKLLALLKDQTGAVTNVMFSPDGHLAMTCNHHSRVLFWRAKGPGLGRILGVYIASYEIEAIHWQTTSYVIFSDGGGMHNYPHLYRLRLEGSWH